MKVTKNRQSPIYCAKPIVCYLLLKTRQDKRQAAIYLFSILGIVTNRRQNIASSHVKPPQLRFFLKNAFLGL